MNKDTKDSQLTPSDLAANVDRVVKAVNHSELSALVHKLHALVPKHKARVCLGLVGNKEGVVEIKHPCVAFRASHIVLTDEAARGFELHSFLLSNVNQAIGAEPIPCDLFSIKHVQDDRLCAMMEWSNAPVITPANRITMYFKRREGFHETTELRGLLWGTYEEIYEEIY